MKVNFVNEFNLFMRYARNNNMTLRERMLWITLFYIANDRAIYNEKTKDYSWPHDFIYISHGEINLFSNLDKRAVAALRNSLKQRGLIDFKLGDKNKHNPSYKINYLSVGVGCKTVPNDVPNSVPKKAVSSISNKYKDKYKGEVDVNINNNVGEEDTINNILPLPTQGGNMDADYIGDEETAKAFPERVRELTKDEKRIEFSLRAYLDSPCSILTGRESAVWRIMGSDRFNLELISEAVDVTIRRNGRFKLDNPYAYMLHLLFDWEERGITTVVELRDSKEDWYERADIGQT